MIHGLHVNLTLTRLLKGPVCDGPDLFEHGHIHVSYDRIQGIHVVIRSNLPRLCARVKCNRGSLIELRFRLSGQEVRGESAALVQQFILSRTAS